MEKRKPSCTVTGDVNWCSEYGVKIEIPYDLAISLLGIYPDKAIIKRCMHALLIAVLLTVTKTQKQPKCPLVDEWVKNIWSVYTIEYYLAIRNN